MSSDMLAQHRRGGFRWNHDKDHLPLVTHSTTPPEPVSAPARPRRLPLAGDGRLAGSIQAAAAADSSEQDGSDGARAPAQVRGKSVAIFTVLLATVGLAGCGGLNDPGATTGTVVQEWTPRRFGVYASESFQNNWLVKLNAQWYLTNNFVTNLSATDANYFYGMMPAGNDLKWYDSQLRTGGSDHTGYGLDTVDLFFSATHGGKVVPHTQTPAHNWSMYPVESCVLSPYMRLGDDTRMLSVFATYACDSLQIDGNIWTRYGNALSGGLRIILGSPKPVGAGYPVYVIGNAFADYLQAGQPFYLAWYNALTLPEANGVAALATGTDATDCVRRLTEMTWQNFNKTGVYPYLRDGAIKSYCTVRWNDDE